MKIFLKACLDFLRPDEKESGVIGLLAAAAVQSSILARVLLSSTWTPVLQDDIDCVHKRLISVGGESTGLQLGMIYRVTVGRDVRGFAKVGEPLVDWIGWLLQREVGEMELENEN